MLELSVSGHTSSSEEAGMDREAQMKYGYPNVHMDQKSPSEIRLSQLIFPAFPSLWDFSSLPTNTKLLRRNSAAVKLLLTVGLEFAWEIAGFSCSELIVRSIG